VFSGHNSSSTSPHRCKPPKSFANRPFQQNRTYPILDPPLEALAAPRQLSFVLSIMPPKPETPTPTRRARVLRAVIEVAFIIFLFYSNLLMGEFNRISGQGKTLAAALTDIFTLANFTIAIIAALIGYVVFEFLRKRL
jgi:hypothetical protein